MLDERDLAAPVALVHPPDLGNGHVALIDDGEEVVAEVVDQRVRGLARRPSVEMPRVVLDAAGEAHRLEHLEVVVHAHLKPLCFEQLAVGAELGEPGAQLLLDRPDRRVELGSLGHVVRGGPDRKFVEGRQHLAGELVHLGDRFDLVPEELDAHRMVRVGRKDVEHVASHPEVPALQLVVVAVVLDLDQVADQLVSVVRLALAEKHRHPRVVLRRADAVDAAHAGYHDDVLAREEGRGRRVTQLLDLGVDRRVLLDERVGRGHVRLGLVVVVVADEVHDRVVRQEVLDLGGELGSERLVGRHHERRLLHSLDDLGHREGLP